MQNFKTTVKKRPSLATKMARATSFAATESRDRFTRALNNTFVLGFVLTAMFVAPSGASAASRPTSCPMVFAPAKTLVEHLRDGYNASVPATLRLKQVSVEAQVVIDDANRAFAKASLVDRLAWKKIATQIGEGLSNPYTMFHDLVAASEKNHTTANAELHDLFRFLSEPPSATQTEELNRWVKSETHAVVLYDILNRRGLQKYNEVIHRLHETNLYFSESQFDAGGGSDLLTYSFEKEGQSPLITMLFRSTEFGEQEWFKLADKERYGKFKFLGLDLKEKASLDDIVPTSLKPSFIGAYSIDSYDRNQDGFKAWEIAHKGYEISERQLMNEIHQVADLFGSTDSIHAHTVFELPKKYRRTKAFLRWFKAMNDTLYLQGIEEGLHGNHLTQVVNLEREELRSEQRDNFSIQKLTDVHQVNSKFFSAGLRAEIYGPASSPEKIKLGLELRDSTRDLAKLDRSLRNVSDAVSSRRWERLADNDLTSTAHLVTSRGAAMKSLIVRATGVNPWTVDSFLKAEPSIGIPFLGLEQGLVFNYQTGFHESASPEYIARAEAARAKAVHALLALQKEIDDLRDKHEKVDFGDMRSALRQIITEWARAAKPSERFSY